MIYLQLQTTTLQFIMFVFTCFEVSVFAVKPQTVTK